jgi:hypothetical protein
MLEFDFRRASASRHLFFFVLLTTDFLAPREDFYAEDLPLP